MAREKKLRGQGEPNPMHSLSANVNVPASSSTATGLSPADEGHLRSRATAASLGEIVGAMLRSERHRAMPIADLEKIAAPAMVHGQFAVANAPVPNRPGETAPVAAIFWASVSADVDARLAGAATWPLPLARNEWASGSILWLVDAVGPAAVVQHLINEVTARSLKGRSMKMPRGALG
jgi:hemolysin-activating ACP:hemolysin acyltransferase